MNNFISKSLMGKLIIMFLLVSIVPVALVGYISYSSAKSSMEQQFYEGLTAVVESREAHIVTFLQMHIAQIEILASNETVQDLLGNWNKRARGDRIDAATLKKESDNFTGIELPEFSEITDFYEYYFIGETGKIYFSTDKSAIGDDMSGEALFRRGLKEKFLTDVKVDEKIEKHYVEVVVPVFPHEEVQKSAIGVIVAKFDNALLNEIVMNRKGLGETGEVYIVNKDGVMITESRYIRDAVLRQKVDTEPVRLFQNQRRVMTGIYEDYRGMTIVGASMGDEIDEEFKLGWTILAEIDEAEAFAPVYRLRDRTVMISLIAAVIVVLLAFFMSRAIARPVKDISENIARVADGDLTVDVNTNNRHDEVGILASSFRTMVEKLRGQTMEIMEGSNVLASAANEILTTVTQLASSAQETASSVTETTTTMEQLKQTADLTNEKANYVSQSSQKAVSISDEGKKSTEATIEGMKLIRDQMESIAESIVRLSEQSQSIGEIITSVNDLSDQSNLLAVNASIEATKAGEQGIGFTVVAQEVKSLAVQSKQATAKVRTILNDIQKATSAAVMSTEQGSKAVDSGVSQSDLAGGSIMTLSNSVREAAQAAVQIAASGRQQLAGIDQVSSAMESIRNATNQNLDGSRQLETAAKNLNDLGQKLKHSVELYKV